jgi:hypothetical protein
MQEKFAGYFKGCVVVFSYLVRRTVGETSVRESCVTSSRFEFSSKVLIIRPNITYRSSKTALYYALCIIIRDYFTGFIYCVWSDN